ncbi:hypothetical protein [Paenibacillus antarcticus]|uniref:Uncharacterized protein n=1 Tax=Paenibacillus antarcticus TaxID=253703 RepID=A0A168MQG4_9BACL|nr:hypothetical protein [Paenibacillus antarcticus]OAB44941.1 hypothetical protein PBAT_13365 [Paenibacillus antarcticus]
MKLSFSYVEMNQAPCIYSGDEPGKIINVKEGKKFWYIISPIKDVEVIAVKEDGTKEIIKDNNHEELLRLIDFIYLRNLLRTG